MYNNVAAAFLAAKESSRQAYQLAHSIELTREHLYAAAAVE
ncbi:hypothetical protein [Cupriavidus basilensis]